MMGPSAMMIVDQTPIVKLIQIVEMRNVMAKKRVGHVPKIVGYAPRAAETRSVKKERPARVVHSTAVNVRPSVAMKPAKLERRVKHAQEIVVNVPVKENSAEVNQMQAYQPVPMMLAVVGKTVDLIRRHLYHLLWIVALLGILLTLL